MIAPRYPAAGTEGEMEAAIGIEPMDKGFADLCLTTWLRRLTFQTKGEGRSCWLLESRPSPENLGAGDGI